MVALLLPIFPISDMIALAAGSNDIIMYINDVAITAERCEYKDGSGSTVPIIVGTQDSIIRFRTTSQPIIINIGISNTSVGTITSTNNTNVSFGTSARPLEEMYTIECGPYKLLLLATSTTMNHVKFWYNGYTEGEETEPTYFIDSTGTAIFNTAKAYNGNKEPYQFEFNVLAFSSKNNASYYYDPTGKTGNSNGINAVSFTFTDFLDGDLEPWWPTGSQTDGGSQTVSNGMLNIKSKDSNSVIFPAQYKISFPIKNISGSQTIDYFIALSGTPVIPVSADDNLLRRWNDVGSILTSISYTNPNEPKRTVDLRNLYNNPKTTLGTRFNDVKNNYIVGKLINSSNDTDVQNAFKEFYLFYSRGMHSGALYVNSNDHARFTRLINEILNSSTGAGYLSMYNAGFPDIKEGAIITATFDRVIGIRIYENQEFRGYYLYNSTGKREFPQKLRNGSMVYHDILGITKYGGYISQMGTNTLEPFPIFANSMGENGPYEIWGYRLTNATEFYAVSDTLNSNAANRTPFDWSEATVQGWENQKSFNETFAYQASTLVASWLKVKIVLRDSLGDTLLDGSIQYNGKAYATSSGSKEALISVRNGERVEIPSVNYKVDGKTFTSYPNINFNYGDSTVNTPSNNKFYLEKDTLFIYVRRAFVRIFDANLTNVPIPGSITVMRVSQTGVVGGTPAKIIDSNIMAPAALNMFFIAEETVNITVVPYKTDAYVGTPAAGYNFTLSSSGNNKYYESTGTNISFSFMESSNSYIDVYLPHKIRYYMIYNNSPSEIFPPDAPAFLTSSTNFTLSTTYVEKSGSWYKNQNATTSLTNNRVSQANLSSIISSNQPISLYFKVNQSSVVVSVRVNGMERWGEAIEHLGEYLLLYPVEKTETFIDTTKVPFYVGDVMYGDVNFDGVIDYNDEAMMLSFLKHETYPSQLHLLVLDINKNGNVDKYDIKYIRECIANPINIKTFKVCKGDINGDGKINSDDVSLVIDFYSPNVNVPSSNNIFTAADINNDGYVDAIDIGYLQNYTAMYMYESYFYRNAKYGDINFDGNITADDYNILQLCIQSAGEHSITPEITAVGDINGDGLVDIDDYYVIKAYVDGMTFQLGRKYTQYTRKSGSVWELEYSYYTGSYSTEAPIPAGTYLICSIYEQSMDKYIVVDANHNGNQVLNYYTYIIDAPDLNLNNRPIGPREYIEYNYGGVNAVYEMDKITLYAEKYIWSNFDFGKWRMKSFDTFTYLWDASVNVSEFEVISTNRTHSVSINKHTIFHAECSLFSIIAINLIRENMPPTWTSIEEDTYFKFDIYIEGENGDILYPDFYEYGMYSFYKTSPYEIYKIYLNGLYTGINMAGGDNNKQIYFYPLKLEQKHIDNNDEVPFEKIYIEGTQGANMLNGFIKGASKYLPEELSIHIGCYPLMAGEQVSLKAVPNKDVVENKLVYTMMYWDATLLSNGSRIPSVFTALFKDINGDGLLNMNDYNALVQYLNENATLTELGLINADVNEDGRINLMDAELLLEAINNSYALGTTQTITMPNEGIKLTAYGDNAKVQIVWQDFYDLDGVYHEKQVDLIKYGSTYWGLPFKYIYFSDYHYLVSEGWFDEAGTLVFPSIPKAGESYQQRATEDRTYSPEYVERMYDIEFWGRTDGGILERIKVSSPYTQGRGKILVNSSMPEFDTYMANGTKYHFTGLWKCITGTDASGNDTFKNSDAIRASHHMAEKANDYSPTKVLNVKIILVKQYEPVKNDVNYYIYNNSTGIYELFKKDTYNYGEYINVANPEERPGYMFDGWYWGSPDGTLIPPEVMGDNNINAYGRYQPLDSDRYHLKIVINDDDLLHKGRYFRFAGGMSLDDIGGDWNGYAIKNTNFDVYGPSGFEISISQCEMHPWKVVFDTGNSGIGTFVMGCPISQDGWELYSGDGVFETRANQAYFKITNSDAVIRVKGKTESIILPHPGSYEGYTFEGWYITTDFWPENRVGGAGDEYEPPYDNITLYARWVSHLEVVQTWMSIEGKNEFRKGTDVILSFTATNKAAYNYITSMTPKADIYIYNSNNEVIDVIECSRLVLVPSNQSTTVWIPYYIGDDYEHNKIRAKCVIISNGEVISEGYGTWYIAPRYRVQTPDTAYSPQKAWWYINNYDIGNVDIFTSTGINNTENKEPDVVSSLSWIEWREPTQGNLVKFENTVSIDYKKTQTYIAPYGDNNAKYDNSDMTWKTKSGYGFTLSGKVSLKFSNAEIERDGAATGVQGANALFPEFNYLAFYHNGARNYITYNKSDISARNGFKNMMDLDGNIMLDTINGGYYGTYATLVKSENGNFILPLNTSTMNNIHYTPVWMPDGGYQVAVYYHDIWTPAGMLSYYDFSNALKLSGDMYDDIWFWSQSFNPANN